MILFLCCILERPLPSNLGQHFLLICWGQELPLGGPRAFWGEEDRLVGRGPCILSPWQSSWFPLWQEVAPAPQRSLPLSTGGRGGSSSPAHTSTRPQGFWRSEALFPPRAQTEAQIFHFTERLGHRGTSHSVEDPSLARVEFGSQPVGGATSSPEISAEGKPIRQTS